MKIKAELVKITPEVAVEWLSSKLEEQRPIRQRHVTRLANDMTAGRFKVSPDAILRVNGKLANGQHRLSALVQAGTAQTFLVMHSDDPELYKVLDSGVRRTVSDALTGKEYASNIASIAAWVKCYDEIELSHGLRHASDTNNNVKGRYKCSQAEMIDYCHRHEKILTDAARFIFPLYTETKIMAVSLGGAIHVIGSKAGRQDETERFLNELYRGGPQNAAMDIRNRLIKDANSRARLNKGYIFGITLKALNSYLNGTRPGNLRWLSDEALPRIS